jgi:hypothetical protein
MKERIAATRPAVERFINSAMIGDPYSARYYYLAWHDSPLIHVRTHFAMLNYFLLRHITRSNLLSAYQTA